MITTETPSEVIIKNPNKAWVSSELDKLIGEWKSWLEYCQNIKDSPEYNPQTCTEVIKDGRANIDKHEILREKTLVFIRNHFSGAEFILKEWPTHPYENNTSRLKNKIPRWIHRLEMLKASMGYFLVTEGYWQIQGKNLLETLSKTTTEKALDVVASYLKNPLAVK